MRPGCRMRQTLMVLAALGLLRHGVALNVGLRKPVGARIAYSARIAGTHIAFVRRALGVDGLLGTYMLLVRRQTGQTRLEYFI